MKPVVYFIQSDCGRIKIGTTRSDLLRSRLKALQTGSPRKLRVIACTAGDCTIENALHKMFASDRLHGEWFRPSKRLVDVVRYIRQHDTIDGWEFFAPSTNGPGQRLKMRIEERKLGGGDYVFDEYFQHADSTTSS